MGLIKFKAAKLGTQLDLGSGWVGHYGIYGFVLHYSDIDQKYRVLWNVGRLKPLNSHNKNPFNSLEEAENACENLLQQLLNKN